MTKETYLSSPFRMRVLLRLVSEAAPRDTFRAPLARGVLAARREDVGLKLAVRREGDAETTPGC